jgi:hypothetical protein
MWRRSRGRSRIEFRLQLHQYNAAPCGIRIGLCNTRKKFILAECMKSTEKPFILLLPDLHSVPKKPLCKKFCIRLFDKYVSKAIFIYVVYSILLTEQGIRYFFPYSLFALPLLQHLFSLSLLRYFSENCNTLLAIRYRYFCFISVADCINFRAISTVKDPQH